MALEADEQSARRFELCVWCKVGIERIDLPIVEIPPATSETGPMLNIVIPMAGLGSRFANAGYTDPKPLIPMRGVPMIRLVIANVAPSTPHRFLFICQRAHDGAYRLTEKLRSWAPGAEVILLDGLTEGAACTVLTARQYIDNDQPLMIANSDQYVDISIDPYVDAMPARNLDGLIMTMQADDPKWSFAAVDPQGYATRVVEKEPISTHATVGIYNFRRGADFVRAADAMIAAEGSGMYGLGIPADLDAFLALPLAKKVTDPLL